MEVKCSSCHGVFEKSEAKCPFCGTFQYAGAEQQYLENLDDIVEDFDELKEQSLEELEEETLDTGKNLLKIFLKTGAIVCVVLGIAALFLTTSRKSPVTEAQQKDQLLWEKATYPMLDEWYAQGEYDRILEYYEQLNADENNPYTLAQWEPLMFLLKYRENLMFHRIKEDYFTTGKITPEDLGKVLISTLEDTVYYLYTEEEKGKVDGFLEEQQQFLQEEFGYTHMELAEIEAESKESGRFDREVCYKEAEERYKERG